MIAFHIDWLLLFRDANWMGMQFSWNFVHCALECIVVSIHALKCLTAKKANKQCDRRKHQRKIYRSGKQELLQIVCTFVTPIAARPSEVKRDFALKKESFQSFFIKAVLNFKIQGKKWHANNPLIIAKSCNIPVIEHFINLGNSLFSSLAHWFYFSSFFLLSNIFGIFQVNLPLLLFAFYFRWWNEECRRCNCVHSVNARMNFNNVQCAWSSSNDRTTVKMSMTRMLSSIFCAKHSVKWQMRYSNRQRNKPFTISMLLQHTFVLVLLVIIVMTAEVYGKSLIPVSVFYIVLLNIRLLWTL